MQRRPARWVVAACVVAVLGSARAVGTIETDDDTIIATGTGTPQGVVTIDPCAPAATPPTKPPLGPLTTQGAITGSLPAKPSTGGGALGDVSITANTVLPGGTYEYTNFEITNDATVSYSGAVTILATESVEIEGRIDTFSTGESVTIVAGDQIIVYVRNGTPVTGIATQGSSASIRLEADRVEIGVTTRVPEDGMSAPLCYSEVTAALAGVVIRAHGTASDTFSAVDVQDTCLRAGSGAMTIQSAHTVFVGQAIVESYTTVSGGDLLCQAFGGSVQFDGGTHTVSGGNGLIESQGDAVFSSNADIEVRFGDLRVESYGGSVLMRDRADLYASDQILVAVAGGTGEVIVAAAVDVSLTESSDIQSDGTGGIRVTAHAGNVMLEEPAAEGEGSSIACLREGGTLVEAALDVRLDGASVIQARDAPLLVRAHGGTVYVNGESEFDAVDANCDVRAQTSISATQYDVIIDAVSGPAPTFTGESVLLVAIDEGISIEGNVAAESGSVAMHADDDITLDGTYTSAGGQAVTIQTDDGSIFVPSAVIRGGTSTNDQSGDVLLESFGGATATIDASAATIVSENVSGESGDVSLLIHGSGAIESFVLPKTVKVKLNEKKPTKSKLVAAGFFDTGPQETDLTGDATISVGGLEFAADLQAKRPFKFEFKGDGIKIQIKTAKSGSSKARFRLEVKGDLMGEVPTEGGLTLRFATAGADGLGTVVLEKGKYHLGRKKGALIAPNVLPFQLKQKHRGPGRDTFLLKAGIVTEGGAPEQAPDVTVGLVGGFDFSVPGEQFELKGGKFVAKRPPAAPDVDLIQIDFAKEQLVIKARTLDLGAIGGARPATIQIGLDDDVRAVSVRLSPKSATVLKY